MTLKPEDKIALINLRIKRAKEAFTEAKGNVEMGFWRTSINRLYYACYYAASALLVKYDHTPRTHSGVISLLGLHFVTTGIISMEQGKLYKNLFEKRQSSDYDEWVIIEEKDVLPFIQPVKNFIFTIEKLLEE